MGALDVVEERRTVRLNGADPVDGAGLEGFHRLRRRAHVAHGDVLEGDAVLLEVIVRHHLERIELECGERLALELFGRIESRSGYDNAALDTAASDDFNRRAGVIEGD